MWCESGWTRFEVDATEGRGKKNVLSDRYMYVSD